MIKEDCVDLVLSHSTLEHVEDLPNTYMSLAQWIKLGGWMSHQIDFRSHGISECWDGYRKYPEYLWEIVKGNRHSLINRAPQGDHLNYMTDNGFRIELNLTTERVDDPQLAVSKRAKRWQKLSDENLSTTESFVVSRLI